MESKQAEFIGHRERVLSKYLEENPVLSNTNNNQITIKILPTEKFSLGISGVSKPINFAPEDAIVCKVNGVLSDLDKPLIEDCILEFLNFDSAEGKEVFWHSTAHILGEALEEIYHCKLCNGPPLKEGGCYYDVDMGNQVVTDKDHEIICKTMGQFVKQNQKFEQIFVPKEVALEMFKYNSYKIHYLTNKVKDNELVSLYRCGSLLDPCQGPHVPYSSMITTFKILKNSSSYWLGDSNNVALQRIYAISFPDANRIFDYDENIKSALERDHRNIGQKQELFFFHPFSPGSAFMLPHGTRIYNKLMNFIRAEYNKRGFTEVVTPNMFSTDLWKKSGHYPKYKENMFELKCEDQDFALKPMNCPGHCLMFNNRLRSYRELPIRFADFGVLHRNELSGALTGLTRVRRFQQDDAHIFCTNEQIKSEIKSALNFMSDVYGIFGFEFDLELSTRPEKFIGDIEQWNHAEKQLEEVLNEYKEVTNCNWKLNPGDGAFYGPKIDIHVKDALKRSHQCATIQLDFQLPSKERFDLSYVSETGENKHPVIIHRAILGSVERMMAILIENYAGKWPFWLSPRQVIILPISNKNHDYAHQIQKIISESGFYVDVDDSDNTISKKILNAQLAQYNYILTVGKKEEELNSVNVRTRDTVQHGMKSIDEIINEFKSIEKRFG
jgi:threonyl-tRNA synthetase